MSFADQGRALWRLRWWILIAAVLSIAVGVLLAVRQKSTTYGSADGELLIDSVPSTFAEINPNVASAELVGRAPLYAEFGTSAAVVSDVARTADVPEDSLSFSAAADQTTPTDGVNTVSGSVATSGAPGGGTAVTLATDGINPLLYISVTSASLATADTVARATSRVLSQAIKTISGQARVAGGAGISLRQLGSVTAYYVHDNPKMSKPIGAGVGVFLVLLLVLLAAYNVVVARRRRAVVGASGGPGPRHVSA